MILGTLLIIHGAWSYPIPAPAPSIMGGAINMAVSATGTTISLATHAAIKVLDGTINVAKRMTYEKSISKSGNFSVHLSESEVLDQNVYSILARPVIEVRRDFELLGVLVQWESERRFRIYDHLGKSIGTIVEEAGVVGALARQFTTLSRSFKANVKNEEGVTVMILQRPFNWWTSVMNVYNPKMKLIGTIKRYWMAHLTSPLDFMHRRYELSVVTGKVDRNKKPLQRVFAKVNTGFLGKKFKFVTPDKGLIGSVQRRFELMRLAREMFTDTGGYNVHMDDIANRAISLDERSIMMAFAVDVDTDFFSDHSRSRVHDVKNVAIQHSTSIMPLLI